MGVNIYIVEQRNLATVHTTKHIGLQSCLFKVKWKFTSQTNLQKLDSISNHQKNQFANITIRVNSDGQDLILLLNSTIDVTNIFLQFKVQSTFPEETWGNSKSFISKSTISLVSLLLVMKTQGKEEEW